jgi:hypothetical protein
MQTPQSPETSPNGNMSQYVVNSKQFNALLSEIIKNKAKMYKLNTALASIKKSDQGLSVNISNRTNVFKRSDFLALDKQLNAEIRNLKSFFSQAKKKVHKPRKNHTGGPLGFQIPLQVNENMQAFFANANLGYVTPGVPQSGPLNAGLSVSTSGLSNRAILTTLLNIYNVVNGLKHTMGANGKINKSLITADALMNQYLGQSYDRVLAIQEAKVTARYNKRVEDGQNVLNYTNANGELVDVDARGKISPWFNPNGFEFKQLGRIVSANVVKDVDPLTGKTVSPALTEQETATLRNEQLLASANLFYYKWQRKIEESKLGEQQKQVKLQELGDKYQRVLNGEPLKITGSSGKPIDNPALKTYFR